jgi:hypothetical protein
MVFLTYFDSFVYCLKCFVHFKIIWISNICNWIWIFGDGIFVTFKWCFMILLYVWFLSNSRFVQWSHLTFRRGRVVYEWTVNAIDNKIELSLLQYITLYCILSGTEDLYSRFSNLVSRNLKCIRFLVAGPF